MILKLSLFRAFYGCMQQGNGAAGGDPNGSQQPPPAARTTFTILPGNPARGVEDRW